MTGAEYVAFMGACAILAVTPGPDTFLTMKFAAHSVRGGLVYTTAVALGVLVWAVLALTGIAALLEQFPQIRAGLTWVGGSYLVFLGVTALLQVRKVRAESRMGARARIDVDSVPVPQGVHEAQAVGSSTGPSSVRSVSPNTAASSLLLEEEDPTPGQLRAGSMRSVFRTGMISSLTNPKTGLFFLALLPPFLPHAPDTVDQIILVATVVACMLVYGALLSLVSRRIGRALTAGSGPLIIDGVAGAVLILLGISLIAL